MQKGTIDKLVCYYMENVKFKKEMERAKNEFFDCADGGTVITIDEKYMPYFTEWLVFDFRLRNGQSLIEDYYYRNPRKLPLYEMQIYKDLENNVYGPIEVQKVYLGEGMDVLMLHTGKKYYVHEHSGTFKIKKGNVIFARVAEAGGRYELASANTFMIDVHMDSRTKKHFINSKAKFSPKDALNFIKVKNNVQPEQEDGIHADDLKREYDDLLDELGVSDMVNTDLIKKWLANINFKRKDLPIVDILAGLTINHPTGGQMDRFLKLTPKLTNHSPHKALNGKSPSEISKKREFGSKGFNISTKRVGGEWPDHANKATEYMKSFNIPKAMDRYEKAFKTLLKEETTGRFIFAVFANMGVCNLYFGTEFTGRKLLNIALELNKNYEFAKNILAELDCENGTARLADTIRFALERARTRELKEFWEKAKKYGDAELRKAYYDISLSDHKAEWEHNPAKKYYDFLKTLEINFNDVKQ